MTKSRQSHQEAKRVRLAFGAAVLLLAVTGSAAVAEVGLRAYQKARYQVPMATTLPQYRPRQFVLSPFLVFGPRVDWQIPDRRHPSLAYFNSQGFRTPERIGEKGARELRIITLGGSTTEDAWNDAGIHWPLILECRLAQAGYADVRVLNAGMSAYSSAHSLVRLALDLLRYSPDLLLVMHNINDLTVNYYAAQAGVPVDPNYLVKYGRKSFTGAIGPDDVVLSRAWRAWEGLLARQDGPVRLDSVSYDVRDGIQAFRNNLRSITAVARAHGIGMVLLTMPASASDSLFAYTREGARGNSAGIGPLPPKDRFRADFQAYNAAIEATGSELGVAVIPMHRLMPDRKDLFVDVVHYSTAGSIAFADALAPRLLELVPDRPLSSPGSQPNACAREAVSLPPST